MNFPLVLTINGNYFWIIMIQWTLSSAMRREMWRKYYHFLFDAF